MIHDCLRLRRDEIAEVKGQAMFRGGGWCKLCEWMSKAIKRGTRGSRVRVGGGRQTRASMKGVVVHGTVSMPHSEVIIGVGLHTCVLPNGVVFSPLCKRGLVTTKTV